MTREYRVMPDARTPLKTHTFYDNGRSGFSGRPHAKKRFLREALMRA